MFPRIKRLFYFPVASYFRFFASIRLKKWNPRVVVITGSSGKTTLLHLVEAQLGDVAKYSHEANSSFGIPFDILDIHRKSLTLAEWPAIFILPWINIFKPIPSEKIYVVEADCDRPNEGNFLSSLLKPEVTLWTNASRTHAMNFTGLIDEAIAHEFGYFPESTSGLVLTSDESSLIKNQLKRTKAKVVKTSLSKSLKKYEINLFGTKFVFDDNEFLFPYLLPKETASSILMTLNLLDYMGVKPNKNFSNFSLPPGRNSFFKGVKNLTIVDSSYNANLDSMRVVINMFGQIKEKQKWVVLGDMLELGVLEKEEHEKLADLILKHKFNRIILMGPRVTQYAYPKLEKSLKNGTVIEHFLGPKEVLDYLQNNLKGGELVLFKGARFLEGVIENLLKDKGDASKLARREKVWDIRRKKWGL